MGSADDRRFEVLRAIVADFVSTKEPIGSKTLVERHNLGVSSATVRNDMAVLEAEGYITQPHTSSGRVPTEKGYREFVDRLDDIKPLSNVRAARDPDLPGVRRRPRRRAAPRGAAAGAADPPGRDRAVSDAVDLERAASRGGGLTPARLLLVVITDSGRVDQRIVELGDAIDEHELAQLRELLGPGAGRQAAGGRVRRGVGSGRASGRQRRPRRCVGRSATVLVESLVEHSEERLLLGGTANLTRNTADFGGSLRSVMEALEEQVVVLRLLAAQQEAGKVTVRIGHETEAEQMVGTPWSAPPTAVRARSTAAWVCWDPPGWTIRELSLMSPRLLSISAKS